MRPPFWEVSLFSPSDSEQPMTPQSIACFIDRDIMRRYVLETLLRFPALRVVDRHLTGRRKGRSIDALSSDERGN